jgi:hypothetical protein
MSVPSFASRNAVLKPLLLAMTLGLLSSAPVQAVPPVTPPVRGDVSAAAEAEEGAPKKKTSPARIVPLRMRDGLRFDPPRFSALPGELLELQIENADSTGMTHNFLLLKPGRREEVVKQALDLGEQGPAKGFVPASSDVLFSAPLLAREAITSLTVKMPEAPGIYPYVCTFPGHGLVMYGAVYVGVTMPELVADTNVPPTSLDAAVPGAGRRPFVQRIFMPDCGPAAIAVALKGNQNFCWDAGECRLRYAWQGSFIDAGEYWAGKGGQLAKVPAPVWWRAGTEGLALRVGSPRGAKPTTKFLGYALNQDGPEFHYRIGAVEIFEQILPAKQRPGLTIHYRVPAAPADVFYDIAPEEKDSWANSAGQWDGPTLHLTAVQAADFSLTFSTPLCRP